MSTLIRVRAHWSGTGVVGPALSTFYLSPGADPGYIATLASIFGGTASILPSGLVVSIPNAGDTIEDSTGEVNGTWADGSTATVTGTGSGDFAKGVGARIVWQTAGIRNGRRVRGSTFLVPLIGSVFDTNGNLDSTSATAIEDAAEAVQTALGDDLRIYSRPLPSLAGLSHGVVAVSVPRLVTWLRSRRT